MLVEQVLSVVALERAPPTLPVGGLVSLNLMEGKVGEGREPLTTGTAGKGVHGQSGDKKNI
jgi:hypothetical protein